MHVPPPTIHLWCPALLVAALGCGVDPTSIPVGIETVTFTARSADLSVSETIASDVPLNFTVNTGGRTFFASDDLAFELQAGALVRRRLYTEDEVAPTLGRIIGLAPRAPDSFYLATESGIFTLEGQYILAVTTERAPLALANVDAGPLAGLWFGTNAALFWRSATRFEEIEAPDAGGAVEHLVLTSDGEAALVGRGDTASVLTLVDDALWSETAPFGSREVLAVAGGGRRLFASTKDGLYRREPDGAWILFPWTSPEITMLAAGDDDAVLALAGDTLLRISAEREVLRFSVAARYLAFGPDDQGTTWASESTGATRLILGTARSTSFARDLAPWLETRCSACHANQTQNFLDFEVFRPLAEEALRRVKQGDMPRCPGGVPCGPDMKLPESDYSILDTWIRDGKQP